jgi:hypothetical protein
LKKFAKELKMKMKVVKTDLFAAGRSTLLFGGIGPICVQKADNSRGKTSLLGEGAGEKSTLGKEVHPGHGPTLFAFFLATIELIKMDSFCSRKEP